MKYYFRILLALILAGITVFSVYYFTNGKTLPGKGNQAVITTASKPPATEKYANKKLLAANSGYELYKTDENILLSHGGKMFEFKPWSSYIDREKPKMYCFDMDGDKRKDIVVRCVSGEEQSTGDYVYDVYILRRKNTNNEAYELITATQDLWHKILDDAIVEELSQLKNCKKCAQFAMTIKGNTIKYDDKTGIAVKDAGYTGYFRSLQDKNGKYLTVETWNKGKGSFFINKDNKLCCEVEVIVKYKDYEYVQTAGTVYFELYVNKYKSLAITYGSMVFRAADDYRIANPLDTAKKQWKNTVKNSASPKGSEAINWIKYGFSVDADTLTQTVDMAKESTDIKYVSSIVISESALVLTAKDGYTFDTETAKKGEFSVTINKNTQNEYEISYTAEVSNDGKTLKINFDKTYPQNSVKTVDLSFGSK